MGVTIDLLEVRINQCLLGLFGYSPKKRIVVPAEHISPELQQALEEAMDENGLSCAAAWELAEQRNMKRLDISSACEALKLKIEDWYMELMRKMRAEGIETKGHLAEVNDILIEIFYLHNSLLNVTNDKKYIDFYHQVILKVRYLNL